MPELAEVVALPLEGLSTRLGHTPDGRPVSLVRQPSVWGDGHVAFFLEIGTELAVQLVTISAGLEDELRKSLRPAPRPEAS